MEENDPGVDSKRNDDNTDSPVYKDPGNDGPNQKAELFSFDPNIISKKEWMKLGLRSKTINTIQHYLEKGGHFYKPGDLGKIYGLNPAEYARLEPYVQIEKVNIKKDLTNEFTKNEFKKEKPVNDISKFKQVDINLADTTAFISLPGIGSKLAQRIINFREKLGGFYSIEQVGETFGLQDSVFQKIKQNLILKTAELKKINVNSATMEELRAHPYIKWNLANAISEYRSQHGNYSSLEDLKKISLVTNEVFVKIKNYLAIQ